jgi:hypothetical protein
MPPITSVLQRDADWRIRNTLEPTNTLQTRTMYDRALVREAPTASMSNTNTSSYIDSSLLSIE